jgi:CxxC motif-containing protein (DUF1111 family)
LLLAVALVLPVGVSTVGWLFTSESPVDAAMAETGKDLFEHEWKPHDPLASAGDGLGPVFNASSCVACHRQGGAGGGGPNEHNVITFTVRKPVRRRQRTENALPPREKVRQGVLHAQAIPAVFLELPQHVDASLRNLRIIRSDPAAFNAQPQGREATMPNCGPGQSQRQPTGINVSQRNTPALFGAKSIDEIPARLIIANERRQYVRSSLQKSDQEKLPVGRASRLPNGKVGRFGWKGQIASVAEFVQAACANELGLGNPGSAQPVPLSKPSYSPPGLDLTQQQCDEMTSFVRSLPQPIEVSPENAEEQLLAEAGKDMFHSFGCADCHTANIGDVKGIYSDLLLHRMGRELQGGGSYGDPPIPFSEDDPLEGPLADEWRTPALWGVADSAPYMHDGRAATLSDAIDAHRGQAARSARAFASASSTKQLSLVTFLQTLRAPAID